MTAPAPAPAPPASPRVRVDAPTGAAPALFGLFSAARVLDGADVHELNGVEYQAVCNTNVTAYPPPCGPVDTGLSRVKEAETTTSWVAADPFALYAADDCPVVGREQGEATAQLRQRFLAGEQSATERTVATGAFGNSPTLADSGEIIGSTTALDLADAVGLLETWLADTAGTGVIHAPRYVAGRVDPDNRRPSGQQAKTLLGNTWSFGAGYPGTAPLTGTDDGSVWLYATAPVTVRRGALVEPADWSSGGFDPRTNAPFLLVERLYVVDWPCRAAAVKTTVPQLSTAVAASGGTTA